ncbi:pseudoazurin [uncultured Litoreibacter sp.]|uniref:pseudoazurin n=1 Tax=uncultured Litoreibacter sp. TaxID=1392394 RepID=UPI00262CCCD0|nr:pseudoazurin [uncultured Litoreibacter sp.]
MLTRRNFTLSLPVIALAPMARSETASSSIAGHHTVMMLNADCNDANAINVFEPAILHIAPGDSVTFMPTNKGHNAASKRGMIPEGAEPWNGAVDEELTVTLTIPGIYGYLCLPHYEVGMVGLIVVGDDLSNLAKAKTARHPGDARRAFRDIFDQLEPA